MRPAGSSRERPVGDTVADSTVSTVVSAVGTVGAANFAASSACAGAGAATAKGNGADADAWGTCSQTGYVFGAAGANGNKATHCAINCVKL